MSTVQIYLDDQKKTDIAQDIGTTSHNDPMDITKSENWITSEGTIYKVILLYFSTRCYYGFIGI